MQLSLILSSACYKPSLQTQYTEESEWTPFDFLSRLVKEWEAAGQLPENSAKKTRQVIIRPGESKQMSHRVLDLTCNVTKLNVLNF